MENYMAKNRKLIIGDYDDDGNLINIKEFPKNDLLMFISHMCNGYNSLDVARTEDLNKFSEEELELIQKIIGHKYGYEMVGKDGKEYIDIDVFYFAERQIKWFRNLFDNIEIEKIKCAVELTSHEDCYRLNVHLRSPYYNMRFTLMELFKFIESRKGIFYIVNNEGKKIYDFVDQPTKKQVAYQRRKNGNRTVFFSFDDWKEYLIEENQLGD